MLDKTPLTPNGLRRWQRALLLPSTLAVGLAGCASLNAETETADVARVIKVYFDGACPDAVDDFVFATQAEELIVWQAVKDDGSNDTKQFQVYFDPFKGADIQSTPTGRTTPKKVDGTIPTGVLYKYTIVGEACPEGTAPLDPFLRVL